MCRPYLLNAHSPTGTRIRNSAVAIRTYVSNRKCCWNRRTFILDARSFRIREFIPHSFFSREAAVASTGDAFNRRNHFRVYTLVTVNGYWGFFVHPSLFVFVFFGHVSGKTMHVCDSKNSTYEIQVIKAHRRAPHSVQQIYHGVALEKLTDSRI